MFRVLVLLLAASVAGCGSSGGGPPRDGGPGDGQPVDQDCTNLPKSQTASGPCCLAYGIDACGAGLFCAAFDGRAQATCYVEHSRADEETCTADVQCMSSSCNATAGKCRSSPAAACTTTVGCADVNGEKYYCDSTCKPAGYGLCQDHCDSDSDCQIAAALHCDTTAHRCVLNADPSSFCNSPYSCPSGSTCVTYGECGPSSGSWTPTKACLKGATSPACATGEVCYTGGSVPCYTSFCN